MATTRNGGDVLEHPIGPDGELSVRVHTGEISLHAEETDTVLVRDLDGRDLEERFQVERTEGSLSIRPRDRAIFDIGVGRRGRHHARLAIRLPRHAAVSVVTASATVRGSALTGEQRYRTTSGSIELDGVTGVLAIDAVSGDVRIDGVGEIELSGRLVSGDLEARGGRLRNLALSTTSGDMELDVTLAGPGPYSIQTVSGDVNIMGATPGLQIHAETVTGEVTSDEARGSFASRGRSSLVVGDGVIPLTFKSISGDLHVASHPSASGVAVSPAAPEPPTPPEPPMPPTPDGAWHGAVDGRPHTAVGAFEGDDTATDDTATDDPRDDPESDSRLAILRDLEDGRIDVATATERLAALEDGSDG